MESVDNREFRMKKRIKKESTVKQAFHSETCKEFVNIYPSERGNKSIEFNLNITEKR